MDANHGDSGSLLRRDGETSISYLNRLVLAEMELIFAEIFAVGSHSSERAPSMDAGPTNSDVATPDRTDLVVHDERANIWESHFNPEPPMKTVWIDRETIARWEAEAASALRTEPRSL